MVKVRIAPSPTGIPHIGNTRTALFNYLFAKHNLGQFILRIEDTDRTRFVPRAEEAIYEILKWLGLNFDGIPVKQSERLSIYKEHAQILKDKRLAYEDNGALRFAMPKEGKSEWQDDIGNKKIIFHNKTQEDFVILKSDGFPTYNFANVVDDHLLGITHVIRGDEFISSTPKHIQLYNAFEWKQPVFAHLPVILGEDHQKLSKRNGAKSVLDYRNEGYLKEAILNFMVLLGWNPGGDKEIMTIDEMIGLFDLKDVNTSSPIFDQKKLLWINGVYIRQATLDELKSKIKNQKSKIQIKVQKEDDALLDRLIPLAQTRMSTLNDFCELTAHFFEEPQIKLDKREKDIAKDLADKLSRIEQWESGTINMTIKQTLKDYNIRLPVLYKIITGKDSGLPLAQSLEILGKQKIVVRLSK